MSSNEQVNEKAYPPGYQNHQGYPVQQGTPQVVYIQNERDEDETLGIILFAVGFCCAVTWWVGACCVPANSPKARTWQKVNRIMTVLSVLILVIVCVLYGVAIFFAVHKSTIPTTTNA
jgi:hypothetical protein